MMLEAGSPISPRRIERLRFYSRDGSTDFLKNMKVELLVEHYGKAEIGQAYDLHNGAEASCSNRSPTD